MKIRNRLLTAFVIMTILPLLLTLCCISFILHKQTIHCQDNYNIPRKAYRNLDFIVNPLNFFYQATLSEYQSLASTIKENPDKILEQAYLKDFDKKLQKKNSYLVVLKNEQFIFNGNMAGRKKTEFLPIASSRHNESENLTFFDNKGTTIVKEKTFEFSDGSLGQVILVSDFTEMRNQWVHSIRDIMISFFIIFLATNSLLTAWIYQSIVRPLNILRLATTQIGNGILNEPIRATSNDEIGQLCNDFDEMRIRLKNIINQQLHTEENMREMLSSLSHDLKTPITAIKGYTEGILDGVADTEEKRLRYLQTIYAKTTDISYLIDELSIYAKVEQNTLAYHFIPVNLEEYFHDCIDYFTLDLEQNHISIDYYNSTDTSTQVMADPEQLRRVMQNIIDNAVKYIENEDGHIYIRIENMPEKTEAPLFRQINEDGTDLYPRKISNAFVRVEIEDNGPGIPAKDLPHIFDRFYRADASRNSSKRGSGLGLAIVKMIILDHGGEVGVDSIEGLGSRFYFTLRKVNPKEEE